MFKELYHSRWKIESKYYEIKEHWELEQFNGATSRSIEQEFYITLVKSNFCSIIKQESDRRIRTSVSKKQTKEYQSTRAHLIGRLSVLFPMYLVGQQVTTTLEDLVMEGVRNKSLGSTMRSTESEPLRKCATAYSLSWTSSDEGYQKNFCHFT